MKKVKLSVTAPVGNSKGVLLDLILEHLHEKGFIICRSEIMQSKNKFSVDLEINLNVRQEEKTRT